MGCSAHALNLFVKDFADEKKASGVAAVIKQVSVCVCVREVKCALLIVLRQTCT